MMGSTVRALPSPVFLAVDDPDWCEPRSGSRWRLRVWETGSGGHICTITEPDVFHDGLDDEPMPYVWSTLLQRYGPDLLLLEVTEPRGRTPRRTHLVEREGPWMRWIPVWPPEAAPACDSPLVEWAASHAVALYL